MKYRFVQHSFSAPCEDGRRGDPPIKFRPEEKKFVSKSGTVKPRNLIVDMRGFKAKCAEMKYRNGDFAERWNALAGSVIGLSESRMAPPPDPEEVEAWARQFPHAGELVGAITDSLSVSRWTGGPVKLPHILLCGPPGIGKTAIAIALAEMLGVPTQIESMAQATARFLLTGSSLTWASGNSGAILQTLMRGTGNPVVVLDELDKAGPSSSSSVGGSIDEALLGLLEPVTARRFKDEALNWPIDASSVGYIATANDPDRISGPVLSRFDVFEIREPSTGEMVDVIVPAIYEDLKKDMGLDGKLGELPEDVLAKLAVNPRAVRKQLFRMIGRAARDQRTMLTVEMLGTETEKQGKTRIGFTKGDRT